MNNQIALTKADIIAQGKRRILKAIETGEASTLLMACKFAGVQYVDGFRWLAQDRVFNDEWNALQNIASERQVDIAEEALNQRVMAGDMSAINMILKAKGGKRGYVDKMRVENVNDKPVDLVDVARRIAFAMNTAIERGEVIDGDFTTIPSA